MSKKIPILKIDNFTSVWTMEELLAEKGIRENDSFKLSIKIGKKKKLKRLRFNGSSRGHCESCGNYTAMSFSRCDGKFWYSFDNHLGNFDVSSIISMIRREEKK